MYLKLYEVYWYLDEISINRKTVQGKCSSFVAAEDIHPSHFLYCCHPFGNGTLSEKEEALDASLFSLF